MKNINNISDISKISNSDNKVCEHLVGVSIVYNNSIMLTRASKWVNNFNIPSGAANNNLSEKQAAIQGVYEKIGIILNENDISDPMTVTKFNNNGRVVKHITYYTASIDNLSDIGMNQPTVNESVIYNSDSEWAGFVNINEAYEIIDGYQRVILDRLKN